MAERVLLLGKKHGVAVVEVADRVPAGWGSVVLGRLSRIHQHLPDGANVNRNYAIAREPGVIKLVPLPLGYYPRSSFAMWRENDLPTRVLLVVLMMVLGVLGLVMLPLTFVLLLLAYLNVVGHKKAMTISAVGVRSDIDGAFSVVAPFKLSARVKRSVGSQSGIRTLKTMLVVKGADGVSHEVNFGTAEELLAFAHTLRSELGLKVRWDLQIDGCKVDDEHLALAHLESTAPGNMHGERSDGVPVQLPTVRS